MFEIRIAVPESASPASLVARFARVFEEGSISFDPQLREVCVRAEDQANRASVVTLSALNAWLSANLLPYATIRLGDGSYPLAAHLPRSRGSARVQRCHGSIELVRPSHRGGIGAGGGASRKGPKRHQGKRRAKALRPQKAVQTDGRPS